MEAQINDCAAERGGVAVQRVVKARHPWQQAFDAKAKLKAARHEAAKRRSLKYRHEHLEERRQLENHWHRKKSGLPLEAPKMKPWDHAKGKCPNDRTLRQPPSEAAAATQRSKES